MLPLISIVVPCYNAAETIERTLRSIIEQHYYNLELIAIDGASNDNTLAILDRYQHYFAKIISEPDRGQANALNKGFRLATGDIFGWLCADDELTFGALAYLANLFQTRPEIDAISAGCQRVFADGSTFNTAPRTDVMQRIGYHNGIEQPSTLWRADLHRRAGELDESYNYAFDWVWWNQLHRAGANVLVVDRVVSCYYFSDTNKTSTGSRDVVNEMYRVIKEFGPIRGYLADIYLFLYKNFDLIGYYDKSPEVAHLDWCIYLFKQKHHNKFKIFTWLACLQSLNILFGRDPILSYNWNFASRQERNLCWYKYPAIADAITFDSPELSSDFAPENKTKIAIATADLPVPNRVLALVECDVIRPRIAIDCCCFESNARDRDLWHLLLQAWSDNGFAKQILAIDRNNTAPQIPGFSYYHLPSADPQKSGHESLRLQQICDREQIDIFLSTSDTITIATPSIAIITDRWLTLDTQKTWKLVHASKCIAIDREIAIWLSRDFPNFNLDEIEILHLEIERVRDLLPDALVDRLTAIIMTTYKQLEAHQLPYPSPLWQSFRELQIATDGYPENLNEARQKLLQAQQTIASMKTTKFWMLRERWFRLKKWLKPT
jgi:glycosyltransferase involved in cell wall biosynthesis